MMRAESEQAARWVRVAVFAQVVVALLAIGVSALAALKVRPLIAQRNALESEIGMLRSDLQNAKSELQSYREALTAARDGINAYHRGDYTGAIASYDSALRTDPQNAYLLDLKGYSQFKSKNFQAAIATMKQAIAADPQYAWAYFDLARVYCAVNDYQNAKDAIESAKRSAGMWQTMQRDGEFTRLCRPVLATANP